MGEQQKADPENGEEEARAHAPEKQKARHDKHGSEPSPERYVFRLVMNWLCI